MQNDATQRLRDFANKNKQTQGKFTIGDEKVSHKQHSSYPQKRIYMAGQEYRLTVPLFRHTTSSCVSM